MVVDLTEVFIGKTKLKQDEYLNEADGLIYCASCHTPRQALLMMGDRKLKPACLCKCQQEKRDEEDRLEAEAKQKAIIAERRKAAFPENKMINITFKMDDQSNPKASSVARKYVEHFEEMKKRGKGLLLYGNVGVGKSFYAACIANAVLNKNYTCLMTNFPRLVNTISGMMSGKQDYIDSLNRYDLLVIDDLATERDSEFMNELVYTIINNRYLSGLPTIFTTNLTAEEMKNAAEIHKQRVFSRVLEMTLPLEVKGSDRRKAKLAKDYTELKDILGL